MRTTKFLSDAIEGELFYLLSFVRINNINTVVARQIEDGQNVFSSHFVHTDLFKTTASQKKTHACPQTEWN